METGDSPKDEIHNGQVLLQFDQPVNAVDDGSPIVGFAIAGEDRRFQPANAEFFVTGKDDRGRDIKDSKILVLSSPLITKPAHFRYAWARSPLGNLQTQRQSDIPLATQRSDNWPLENVPSGVVDSNDDSPKNLDRGSRRKLLEAMKQLDRQRRLAAAKALIQSEE